MDDRWRHIEAILDRRAERSDSARERRDALRPPASAEAIARAEAELGLPLTDEFKSSLRVHDGQDPNALEVFTVWGLHSLAEALRVWRFLGEMAREGLLGEDVWRPDWLPIARDGGGNHLLLDLCTGAIRQYRRAGATRSVAPSLRAWLTEVAATLPLEDDARPDDEP